MSSGLLHQVQLSSRNAAGDLRRHVLNFIRSSGLEPGSRLATEAEIVGSLRVSRSTVRRALDPLEKDGWIDRRAGSGTFVGMRVRQMLIGNTLGNNPGGESKKASAQIRARRERGIVRVAVLIYKIGDLAHDWYTPGILEGLDQANDESHVIVELLGDRDSDIDAISARLERSRPDALVVLSNQPNHAFVIRDAQKLGIPCFVSGTPHRDLNVPSVCEDNRQAMRLAMDHLLSNGHRQVGLILPRLAEPWVFERLEQYTEQIAAASSPFAIHWTAPDIADAPSEALAAEALKVFINQNAITAVLPCHLSAMLLLNNLVRAGSFAVPRDLSVVSFEQDQMERRYLGIADADRIEFPLRAMGSRLAELARESVHAGSTGRPQALLLPAVIIKGSSVRKLSDEVEGSIRH